MNKYWKTFWDQHVEKTGDDPFCQVARTLNKQPMSEAMFLNMADHIVEKLELEADHVVLDLCCGNGLLSAEIAQRCQCVVGVDFNDKLIENIGLRESENIIGIVSNALEIKFRPKSFDRILFAAALQHFSQTQAVRLFKDMALWIKPGGLLFITDITDSQRIWNFYNNQEREDIYFQNTMEGTPVLGTWFDRVWLEKLAHYAGFSQAQSLDQPDDYWYAHYRFDLLCRK